MRSYGVLLGEVVSMMIVIDSSSYGVDGIDWVSANERFGPFVI
jgi:hypothetical protein